MNDGGVMTERSELQREHAYYAKNLEDHRSDVAMLRGLLPYLRDLVRVWEPFSASEACPQVFDDGFRAIPAPPFGVQRTDAETWWRWYRPRLVTDVDALKALALAYEAAMAGGNIEDEGD
jgi:hypothetical protein